MPPTTWKTLNRRIETCRDCPRLIAHCREIARVKRKAYLTDEYWGGPVPNFGDPNARLLIVGLAPGAHGANRTGRMFTGDRSGDWLYRTLHSTGFANQVSSTDRNDGLQLIDCAITAVCHCAPPDNRPTREEMSNCRHWLDRSFELTASVVVVALGQVAWRAAIDHAVSRRWLEPPRPKFAHGAEISLSQGRYLLGCYHPSQQNTFTGRLTETMLDAVFERAAELIAATNIPTPRQ